jgi:hypothetical protein
MVFVAFAMRLLAPFFTILSPFLFVQGESGDVTLLSCHTFLHIQWVFG